MAKPSLVGDARRVAEADHGVRLVDDHRPALGLDDLDDDRVAALDLDGLGVDAGGRPAVRAQRLDAAVPVPVPVPAFVGAPQPLAVQVLVVGHGVGDRPRDRAGVPEVGEAGYAGHGEPDHVELGAGQPDLLVDAGRLDEPVRIARDECRAGGGALAGHQPAVAAGGAGAVGGEQLGVLLAEVPDDVVAPQLGGEAREEDVRRQPHGERRPRLPPAGASPVAANSGERRAPRVSPSLTPSTYAHTQVRVGSSSASKQRRAVSASRERRAKTSQPTASGPRKAAVVPWARCRSTSSRQARSRAVVRPCAWASSCASAARRCGMPQVSR